MYWLTKLQGWFYPYTCILCLCKTTTFYDLCTGCLQDFPWLPPACKICSRLLPMNYHAGEICGFCLLHPTHIQQTIALFKYEQPVNYLIHHLKFNHKLVYGKVLGTVMAAYLKKFYSNTPLPQAIIPVPLHNKRLRERGYNQAIEIARPIACQLKIPLYYKSCKRVKATLPQAQISAKDRQKNLLNAFNIDTPLPPYVAIIDDVMTTGHTINELAKTLKNAGVEKIDVWLCARAMN